MVATLSAPGGPALTVTGTALDLLLEADGDVAFRLAGGSVAVSGVTGLSLAGADWEVLYNGTGTDVLLDTTTLLAAVDLEARSTTTSTTLTVLGQALTVDTLVVTRTGQALVLQATGVGLALSVSGSTVLTVSGAAGAVTIDGSGVTAVLTGTATTAGFGLATLTSAAVDVAINTRSVAALGLAAGPYVRVVAAGTTLTVGSLGTLTGSVAFERQTGTGGAPVLVLALSGITAVAAGANELLTGGTGLLIVPASGVAGFLSGAVGAGAGAGFSGDALLRVNTTGAGVQQSVVLDGRTVEVTFDATEAAAGPVFSLSLTGAVLDISGIATVKGDLTFSSGAAGDVFAGRGLTVFVGVGPAWLADGSRNPLARGLLVTGATVGVIRTGTGPSTAYAFIAQGAVQLIGLSGISLSGTLSVRVNTLGSTVSESIAVPGGDPVLVEFVGGEGDAGDFVEIGGTLVLTALGQTITGTFSFTPTPDGFDVSASGVSFLLVSTGASAPVASLVGGTAELRTTSAGVVGAVTGTVTIDIPGVSVTSGTFDLLVNTTGSAVLGPFGGFPGDVPAGPFLRLMTTGAIITVGGQQLTADVTLERRSSGGAATTTLTLANGSLQVGPGTFVLSGVAGALVLSPAGVAGRLDATVDSTSLPVSLSGAVSIAVNTTSAPALGLPAGPFLRVVLLGATLTAAGQTITADLAVDTTTTFGDDGVAGGSGGDADGTITRIVLTRASFAFPTSSPLVRLVNGIGTFLVTGTDVAGELSGSIQLAVPGVTVSGTLVVRVNTGSDAVDETIEIGGLGVHLLVPAGPYVRVAGLGLVVTVLGQTLTGDVTIEQGSSGLDVTVANASLVLAGGLASITGASASLLLDAGVLSGTFVGTVTLAVPGVSLTGTVSADIDSGAGTVRIGGAAVTLTVAGQAITGTIWFARSFDAAGRPVVAVTLTGVSVSVGGAVSVTGANGSLVISADGIAGAFDATATFSLPGTLTLADATVSIQVNTRSTAVVLTSPALTLPAGPYVRAELVIPSGSPLTIGALGTISGTFAFQRSAVAGSAPVTVLAVSHGAATLSAGGGVTDATGVLVLAGGGVAGYLSGDADASLPGFSLGASVLLRVNTTGLPVDEVVSVGGRDIEVVFDTGDEVFRISVTGATLTIADIVSIEGDFSAAPGEFAGRDLTVFVGDGPAFLEDGSRNPLARGLLITGATVGFVVVGGFYALDVRGTVELIGFAGVTLSGQVRARVNETDGTVDETIVFPDGNGDVVVAFGAAEVAGVAGSAPFVSVTGVDLQVSVLGQTFSGDLSFAKSATGLTVTATNLSLVLRAGATEVASLTDGAGEIQLTSAGVAAVIAGTVAVALPGVTVSGGIRLELNTTGAAVVFDAADAALDTTLAAGPYLRLTGTSATLTVAGQSIVAGTLDIERRTEAGSTTTRLGITGGTLDLTDGTTSFLTLGNVRGSLVLGAGGASGRLAADVTTLAIPGLAISALSVAVNTATTVVDDLPAGPYLRVEVLGARLSVAGQTATADLALARATTAGGDVVVRAGVSNLALSLSTAGQPVASLSGGQGVVLLTATGLAAYVTGTVTVAVPGVSLEGDLALEVNTTGVEVNEVIPVGDSDLLLAVPAGTGSYLRLAGTGLVLTVLGQRLSGDVVIEQATGTTHLLVTDASLDLGEGLVVVSGASADITVTKGGVHGSFSGTMTVDAPGVTVAGSVTVVLDTRPATRSLRVTGTAVTVGIAGQTLHADIAVQRGTTADGSTVVEVAIAGTSGMPFLTLTTGTTEVLVIDGAVGQLVIGSDGVAGSLSVSSFTFSLPAGITVVATELRVDVNTGTSPVSRTFLVGGTPIELTLPAGPYLRVEVVGAELTLGASGPTLSGSFAVEQRSDEAGAEVVVIAATDVEVDVTVGSEGARLTGGEGAFVLLEDGLAGYLSGRADVAAGPVAAGADILVRVNTTPGAVDTSIEVGGRVIVVKFATGDVFEVSVSGLSLTIADFLTIEGSVSFSDTTIGGQAAQVFAGEGLTIFLGSGPALLDTGETNPLAMGVLLTDGRVGLVKIGTTYALFAQGTVRIVGVDGVVLTGTVTASINTTGVAVDETLTIPGSTGPGIPVLFADGAVVTRLVAAGATLSLGGQSLTGTFAFDRSAGGDLVIAATDVSLSLGSAVTVTAASGLLVAGAAGVAGTLNGTVALTVPGIAIAGTLSVAVNTTAAPVSRLVDLGSQVLVLDLPTGPFLRVGATHLTVTVLGQSLTADVVIERGTAPGGAQVTTIGLTNVDLALGAGSSGYGVRLTGGQGVLLVSASGVAGRISGSVAVTLPAGVGFSGALSLAVNTTSTIVGTSVTVGGSTIALALPAGPYLRFESTGTVLTVLGQDLLGNVSFERALSYGVDGVPGGTGPDADVPVVRIAVSGASLAIGGATPVLTMSNGTAVLLLTPSGLAGRVTGSIALTVPDVSLSGSLAVELSTLPTGVQQTFTVGGGAPVTLSLPAGPFVRVLGTGIALDVLGQTLRGDLVFIRGVDGFGLPVVTLKATNLSLRLGGTPAAPVLTATQLPATTAEFVIGAGGLAGHVDVALGLSVPGVSITGSVAISVNTTLTPSLGLPAGPFFRVAGTGVTISVLGQAISADLTLTQVTLPSGLRVATLGLSNASLTILGTPGVPVVGFTGGTGLFAISASGVSGSLDVGIVLDVGGAFSVTGALQLQLNTALSAVTLALPLDGSTVGISLPAGPYLRISGRDVSIDVGGQRLRADIAIEKATGPTGPLMRLAATNVSLALGDGTRNILTLTAGQALFVTGGTGIAGRVSGTVALVNVPGVTLSGSLALELNTTGALVDQTFVVGGVSTPLNLAAGIPLRVRGTGVTLGIGGQSLTGDVTLTKSLTPVPSLRIDIANGSLALGTPSAPLVRATGVSGSVVLVSDGLYGSLMASVALDVPSVSLSGGFALQLNTTLASQTVDAKILAPGLRIVAMGATLSIAGQSMGGSVVIERRPGPDPEISIAVAELTLSLGGVVSVDTSDNWSGALLITPTGVAATFSGNTTGIFTLPTGLGLTGGDVELAVNTGTAAVDRTFVVVLPGGATSTINLQVPAGPFLHLSVGSAANPAVLTVGSLSFSGAFVFSQSTRAGFPGPGTPLGTATTTDSPVAVGDVDGDGTLDLLIGSGSGASVFLGTGSGAFSATSSASLTGGTGATRSVTLADLDGDHTLDALVVRGTTSAAYRNLGVDGTGAWLGFAAVPFLLTTPGATSAAVGDVDGSGFRDVVVGGSGPAGSTGTMVFLNLGRASTADPWLGFATAADHTVADGATTTLTAELTDTATAGDSIAVTSTSGFAATGTVQIGAEVIAYSAKTATTFTIAARGATPVTHTVGATVLGQSAASGVALVDLDNDALLDLVVANSAVDHAVYLNRGPGVGGAWQPFADADAVAIANTAVVTGVAAGDLTGDGYRDVLVAVDGGPAVLHLNNGATAGIPGWQGLAAGVDLVDTPAAPAGRAVAIGDVDGDGTLDVVLATASDPVLFLNRGKGSDGSWLGVRAGQTMGSAGSGSVSVALANVDGDTDLDAVLGGATGRAQLLTNAATPITLLAFTGVEVTLTADVGVSDGQGAFLLVGGTGGGVAGTFSGTAAAGSGGSVGGGFSADVSVAVRFNSTTSAVDEIIEVGGTQVAISFSGTEVALGAGGTDPFVEVSGSGTIRLGDFVEVRGGFTFGSTTATAVTDVSVFMGQGPGFLDDGSINPTARGISVTGASGWIINVGTDRALSITGTVALVGIPGITLSGTISVFYNETTGIQFSGTALEVQAGSVGTPYALLGAENLTLTVGGQSLTGAFSFEKSGQDLTVLLGTAAAVGGSVTLSLGDPTSGGAAPVVVTVPSGELTVSPAGIYGVVVVTLALNVPGVTFDTGPVELRINTTPAQQVVSLVVLPATSFRVQLGTLASPVTLGFGGQSLSGVFAFEQVTGTVSPGAPPGTQAPRTIRVIASGVEVTLGTATAGVVLTGGSGVFVLTSSGMAGRVQGTVTFHVPGPAVQFTGTISLAVNSTTVAVRESVVLDGQTVSLDLPAGPYLRLEGTGVVLSMFGQRLTGDFVFEQASVGGGSVVRVAARNVTASFGDGTTAFVTLTGGTGFFVLGDPDGAAGPQVGGLAGTLSGTVVIAVPGVALTGALTLAINNRPLTDGAVTDAIAFGLQPGSTTAIAVADVNGDTRPDLVLGTTAGVLLYLNDGVGDPFDSVPAILVGPDTDSVTALALGDLDGDSAPDLVVGRSGATTLAYLNDGSGLFTPVSAAPDLGSDVRAVAIGDVKGDAYADVLVVDATTVSLFENRGLDDTTGGWLGVLAGAAITLGGSAPTHVVMGDLDADGTLDLVATVSAGADEVYLGNGDGTWTSGVPPGTSGSTAIALADVDGNGTLDLVRTTGTGVDVALNPGDATWSGFSAASAVLTTGTVAALGIGDLDGDAVADLIISSGTGAARWMQGSGTGTGPTAFEDAAEIGVVTLDLPAGPYFKVVGDPVTLTVAGLQLTGSFSFEQSTLADGSRLVTVTATGISLLLDGIGAVTLDGALVLGATGMAGELTLSSSLSFGAGIGITGTFTLQLTTATTAVVLPSGTRLPAGPYVRFVATGMVLDFGGPTLTANLSVESATTSGGARRTVVAVSGGSLAFEGVGVLLTGVQGIFVLAPTGLAGSLRGTIDLSGVLPAGVTFAGTFGLQVNRGAGAVTESVTLGGQVLALDLPAGPYLRVFGEGVAVSIAGQTLTGNVAFAQSGTGSGATTTIEFSEVGLRLGDGSSDLVVVSGGAGTFTLSTVGPNKVIVGSMSVDVALTVPGVVLTGSFSLEIDTTPGAQVLRVGGSGLSLEIGDQRLGGTFWFEQQTVGLQRIVKISATNVTLFLGDDAGTTSTADDRGLSLTSGSGSLLLTSAGIAAQVSGTVTLLGLDDLPFAVGPIAVALQVNTMPTAVVVPSLSLDLPAGQFLRIQIGTTATPFTMNVFGQSISGVFLFEQVRSAGADTVLGTTDDRQVLRIAATQVSLFVGHPGLGSADDGDEIGIRVSGGTALLLITPDGFAGSISATASLLLGNGVPAVTATVAVEINQLTRVVGGATRPIAVSESFVLNGVTSTLALPAGNYLKVSATGLSLEIAGQRLTADLSVERRARLAADGSILTPSTPVFDVTVRFANVGLRLGTPERDVVVVTNGAGTFEIIGATAGVAGGIAGRMTASVAVDIPGVVFSGTFEVQVNTTASSRTVDTVLVAPGLKINGLAVSLDVAGQRLTGSFSFQKDSATGVISIGLSNVSLALGNGSSTFVTLAIASGAILVTPATPATMGAPASPGGIAARITASISLSPSLSSDFILDSATAELVINTSPLPASGTVLVGTTPVSLSVPAGPYLRIQVGQTGSPLGLTVLGQSLTAVVVFEQRTTSAGTKVVRVAFTEVSLFLGDANGAGTGDDVGVRLTDGAGALILTPAGLAGEITGAVTLVGLPVGLDARLTLQVNSLAVAVNETVQFAGVDVLTTAQGSGGTPEVQTLYLTQTAGTFTLGLDVNGNGRIDAAEISAPIEIPVSGLPSAATIDAAIEALYGSGDNVTVAAVAGGWTVTWNANGNRAPLVGNVRVLALPKGPFLRLLASDVDVVVGGVTIHADVAFDRAGPPSGKVTRIAFANASISSSESTGGENPGLKDASGALIIFSPGAATTGAASPTTTSGGVAGLLTGRVSTGGGAFGLDASLGFSINTTGQAVDQTIDLGTSTLVVDLPASPTFLFQVQDLDFDFGDLLEIHGNFAVGAGTFQGTGLEVFVGKGPGWTDAGDINPDAIGVRVTGAEIGFKTNDAGPGYAIRVTGLLAFVGLDGLEVSGTVTFEVNTATVGITVPTSGTPISPGRFSFIAAGVRIAVAGVVELTGTLGITRQPDGTLDVVLGNAAVLVSIGGTDVARLGGYGAFTISPVTGFRLSSFRVDDFAIFPQNSTDGGTPGASAPTLFPTADLASPLRNAVVTPVQVATSIDVVFNDVNGVGLRENTITDVDPEFQLLVNGSAAGFTVAGVPTRVADKINTWRYTFTGTMPANAVVTVRFLPGAVTDLGGSSSMAEDELFYVFTAAPTAMNPNPQPGPIASLASPSNGGSVTSAQLNAQRYIDITYTSLDGTAVKKSSLEVAAAPFTLTGTGVTADLAKDASSHPFIVGLPLLISGRDAGRHHRHLPLLPQGLGPHQRHRYVPARERGGHLRRHLVQRGHHSHRQRQRARPHRGLHHRPRGTGSQDLRRPDLAGSAVPPGPEHRHRGLRVRRRDGRPHHRRGRRPCEPRLRRNAVEPERWSGRPDRQRGHGRPDRHHRDLRPRCRRLRPPQRQRARRADREVEPAGRLARGTRSERGRPRGRRDRRGLRPERRRRPGARPRQQRDHHAPAVRHHRLHPPVRHRGEVQHHRQQRRDPGPERHSRPRRPWHGLQPRHGRARLRVAPRPGATGQRPDDDGQRPEDQLRRNPRARRHPGGHLRAHRDLRRGQPLR